MFILGINIVSEEVRNILSCPVLTSPEEPNCVLGDKEPEIFFVIVKEKS